MSSLSHMIGSVLAVAIIEALYYSFAFRAYENMRLFCVNVFRSLNKEGIPEPTYLYQPCPACIMGGQGQHY